MTTASRCAAAIAIAGLAGCGCGPGTSAPEPEQTLLERLGATASGMDMFHGIATRGADCTHDLERLSECSDVHRVASVTFEVDWAPNGLHLPVDAPAFEEYTIGLPGNFPTKGPGYLSVYRWVPLEGEEVTITCGDVVIPDGQAHNQPVLSASDEEVAASGFTHDELRAAIQDSTARRVTDSSLGQLGGCPDCPSTQE